MSDELKAEDKTGLEQCEDLLKELEVTFNTGPIIGDAREPLLEMINKVRAFFIASGWTQEEFFEHYENFQKADRERDDQIIEKRIQKSKEKGCLLHLVD